MTTRTDVVIVGAGHNGLVAAILLARRGLKVTVVEEKDAVGGAAKTEYPFARAPRLGVSTGAYLLGLAPPELLAEIGVELPLIRRDPHYFLPTTDRRYLMFGADAGEMRRQFLAFFSEEDLRANQALQRELAAIREDVAKTWLEEPLSIEETAERYLRPELRAIFVRLCRGSIAEYIDRFGFKSDLLKGMYAVTDAFSGLSGGYDTDGTGMNFLVHNMCRLPGSDGTWMIVRGGMGTVTRLFAEKAEASGVTIVRGTRVLAIETTNGAASGVELAGGERLEAKVVVSNADPWKTRALAGSAFPAPLSKRLDEVFKTGTTFKVNLCFDRLPVFKCLPEDRGQYGPTIHLLPDEDVVLESLRAAHRDAAEGRLPEFPSIEWYFHTPLDPTLRDPEGRHNGALFVQWVPHTLAGGKSWADQEERYAKHLLSICDRFAPGTSDAVIDMVPLSPAGIERHFGITGGHIHHLDNGYGFADRMPYRFGVPGLYLCSAGAHPAGSVIGASGHNAANAVLADLGLSP